jgi:protease-4
MEELNQSEQPKMPQYPPQNTRRKPRSSNWWIPLVIIGSLVIVFFIVIGIFVSKFSSAFEKESVEVKENSVLYLTFSGDLPEYGKTNPFSFLGEGESGATFFETIKAIEYAKNDNKIKGIYLKPSTISSLGSAKAIELQGVLEDFKKSGKFIYAFLEAGNENTYFNILPADSIFMPTEGMMELNGFGISGMFLKGFFEKLGINFTVMGFEDFKSAGDMYDKNKFTDSSRYQLKVLLEQRYNDFVTSVSKFRKKTKDDVTSVLNRGIYTTDSLKALGFVDVLATENTVKEFIKYKVNGEKYPFALTITNNSKEKFVNTEYKNKLTLVSASDYLSSVETPKNELYDENTQIAIVNGVGAISSGSGGSGNEYEIKSDDFVKELRKARDNKKVKAIILRIDSPGGSVLASDQIWEEIIKAKSVKPVYASMGNVAASGGYYMAMACDTIIAHPSTITGSIGVILAIPNLSGTMDKLGITSDTLSTGPAAQFMNGMYPFDKGSLNQLHGLAQTIYFRFLNRVAESRKMTFDQVRAIAKGRVWTGEDGRRIGIVDSLGGIYTAINMVKNRLGIPLNKKVTLAMYPEKEDEVKAILKMFGLNKGENDEETRSSKMAELLGLTPKQLINSYSAFPQDFRNQLNYMLELAKIANTEKTMYALPYLVNIK